MSLFISFGLAIIIFYFAQVSFGFWLLHKHPSLSALEKLVFGTLTSLVFFAGVTALVGMVIGPRVFWLLLLGMAIWGAWHHKLLWTELALLWHKTQKNWVSLLLVILATSSLVSTVIVSGTPTSQGVWFQETHDNLWHIALAEQLQKHIPPQHPSFPEVTIQNYHYFYDLILSAYASVTGVPLHFLYFQFFSVVTAGLLAATAYICGKKLAGVAGARLLVLFTFFVGSFAYAIPWFLPGQSWHESSFWVSQTFVMMLNPQVIFSFAMLYMVLFLLHQETQRQDNGTSWYSHLIIIGVIASSIGFKSYAWVVLSCLYGVYLVITLVTAKNWQQRKHSIALGILLVTLSLPFVWLITGFKTGTFFYEPLWYINTMIEAPDRLNYLPWKFEEQFYRDRENWPKVLQIKAQEVVIFFVGNLGVRVVFVGLAIVLFKKSKRILPKKLILAIFCTFLVATIFPLLFLQKGVVVWNSIQFWYYGLILANVLAVIFFGTLYNKKNSTLWLCLIAVVLLAGAPTYLATIPKKLAAKQGLTAQQHAFLTTLSAQDSILICPEGTDLYNTQLIATHTPAQVYLSQTVQLSILGFDSAIQKSFEELFSTENTEDFKTLLETKQISVVLCSDPQKSQFITKSLTHPSLFTPVDPPIAQWLVFTR